MAEKFQIPKPPSILKPKPQPKPTPKTGGLNLGPPPKPPVTSGKQPPAFVAFVNKYGKQYPGLRKWAPTILQYAKEAHIDPLYFASVILTESGANENTHDSSAGAIGLGQIMPLHIGEAVPWNANARVTQADLRNPVFNLRWSAYYLARQVGNYGYAGAYSQGYNPGYVGPDPLARLPKGYLAGVSSPQTSGAPGAGTPTGPAATPSKDPWVVVTGKGGLKFVTSTTAPKNVLRDAAGEAITRSQFVQVKNSLDSLYLPYTGRQASVNAVARYLRAPVSDYQLQLELANPKSNPNIYKSPIWSTHAPDYEATYRGIYGNDAKPPKAVILAAIAHNLSQTGFQDQLRQRSDYKNSEEYKGMAAQFRSGYESVYGTPDQIGEQNIDQAVRKGWNGDQWMQWLRSQPEYTSSGEFQKNVIDLFNKLGFTQGKTNVAAPLTSFGPQAPTPDVSLTATGSAPSNG